MKKLILTFKNFVLLFVIVILGILSYYFIQMDLNDYDIKNLSYEAKADVKYNVFLKKNKFFDTDSLPMDKTYISNLINYVDIDFDYNLDFNEKVSGTYTYYVRGTISADIPNTNESSYWSREYTLTSPQIVSFDDTKNINFNGSINIDYQKYNDILKSFRDAYGLSLNGKMRVELIVNGSAQNNIVSMPLNIDTTSYLDIPLTEQVIDISINKDSGYKTDIVSEKIRNNDGIHKMFFVIGAVIGLGDLFLIYLLYKGIRKIYASQSEYDKILDKILSTYDAIIVNVKEIPKYGDMKVIKTNTFDELIDAHSEVRRPINFCEIKKGKTSKFALISENMVWEYELNGKNLK